MADSILAAPAAMNIAAAHADGILFQPIPKIDSGRNIGANRVGLMTVPHDDASYSPLLNNRRRAI